MKFYFGILSSFFFPIARNVLNVKAKVSVFFTTRLVDLPHHKYYTTDINYDSGEGQKVTDGYLKSEMQVVYRDVNGKRFFGSSHMHWKIPGTNGNSEKVVPFSRLGCSEWKFVYHLQVS